VKVIEVKIAFYEARPARLRLRPVSLSKKAIWPYGISLITVLFRLLATAEAVT
jgi:hypothetical protein